VDSPSGFTRVFSSTKKTSTQHTRVLTFAGRKLGTMLKKTKFCAKCSSLLFCFITTAVFELCTVRCLGKGFSKQPTCYWGSYQHYFLEASIRRPMVLNGVVCRVKSPYKVNWHSWLKNGKRTMNKVVTKLRSTSCGRLSSDKYVLYIFNGIYPNSCDELILVQRSKQLPTG